MLLNMSMSVSLSGGSFGVADSYLIVLLIVLMWLDLFVFVLVVAWDSPCLCLWLDMVWRSSEYEEYEEQHEVDDGVDCE